MREKIKKLITFKVIVIILLLVLIWLNRYSYAEDVREGKIKRINNFNGKSCTYLPIIAGNRGNCQ